MLMTLYSTGMRRAELCHLKVEDIDSIRMIVHIRHGKRNRDREVPLSPKLLETLREYWRGMHLRFICFPARKMAGERISRSLRRSFGRLAGKRRKPRVSAKTFAPIYCAIAWQRTWWRTERIYRQCSCYSDTPA
jgi:integrase